MHQGCDDDDTGIGGMFDHEQPPPIDILPDDVLIYLVDGFLDDRSLGACLLAWRRFHVLDRGALYRRKYRWTTFFSLCAAGDVEGVDYALGRPDLFALHDEPSFWRKCLELAATGGHTDLARRLALQSANVWPLDRDYWLRVVLRLGQSGKDDTVAWLCRKDNRPAGSNDSRWLTAYMVIVIVYGYHPGDAHRVVRAAWTGATDVPGETAWTRLHDVAQGPDVGLVAAAITRILDGSQTTATSRTVILCLERGHFGLLKDLVGDARLTAVLAHITRRRHALPLVPRDDIDSALWMYEHVPSASQDLVPDDAVRLLDAASHFGRIDVLDRVLPFMRLRWPETATGALARAYATAALMGHDTFVERVLTYDMDTTNLDTVFEACSRIIGTRFDGARSPLVIHRGCDDLERVLLDRRPPVGIPQVQVDARVDHMVALTVHDALDQGDIRTVRRLCARSDRDRAIVEAMILRLQTDAITEADAVAT
ncbi:hypothetical protein TW95_gp0353 [Pandoravirus inopinatum]|uniref:Uncharacterized protein n=1 Tax=Pandoravirus inopinatum TaxID=1605721 RepID=A0A0B5JBY1_9VIRU|nr:hypothetical protein TW95_gp0353 [Pandoravirus inopinatum]AJF97087.1 hypothetical protein [Pandoravirus inopinatum]